MQKSLSIYKTPLLLLPLLLAACASDRPVPVAPTPVAVVSPDQLQRESEGIAMLSNRMKNGKQLIAQGQVKVQQGQATVDEGNRMIDEGRRIVDEAQASYNNIKN